MERFTDVVDGVHGLKPACGCVRCRIHILIVIQMQRNRPIMTAGNGTLNVPG